MKLCCLALAVLMLPGVAAAQRSDDRAQFDARMNVLQRSLAELSAQIQQLDARDRELQQQLQRMRDNYEQRLERLEKGTPRARPRP
jgi:peptidoglycan hydrolase CwlO-like protein